MYRGSSKEVVSGCAFLRACNLSGGDCECTDIKYVSDNCKGTWKQVNNTAVKNFKSEQGRASN